MSLPFLQLWPKITFFRMLSVDLTPLSLFFFFFGLFSPRYLLPFPLFPPLLTGGLTDYAKIITYSDFAQKRKKGAKILKNIKHVLNSIDLHSSSFSLCNLFPLPFPFFKIGLSFFTGKRTNEAVPFLLHRGGEALSFLYPPPSSTKQKK